MPGPQLGPTAAEELVDVVPLQKVALQKDQLHFLFLWVMQS